MKKYILLFALSVFILSAVGQEDNESKKTGKQLIVPQQVLKAFQTKYPQAAKLEWEQETPGQYEAEFVNSGTETSAVYDEEGILLEEETAMEQASLPQPVKDALAGDFKKCKINEVEKVTANDVVTFEMEAKCGKKKCELVFDNNGKLLEKEEMKADEDKD
jgi:hypothetical protein